MLLEEVLLASTPVPLSLPALVGKRCTSIAFARSLQRRKQKNTGSSASSTAPTGLTGKELRQRKKGKVCLRTQARLAEIWRKLSAHRRNLIGRMVNETLHMGNVFKLEELSYRVLQGMFGKSIATRVSGKYF